MEISLPTKPENYRPLIKRSLKLYRLGFRHVILFALCLAIIAFIPRYIAVAIGQESFFPIPTFSFYRLLLLLINIAALPFFIAIIWHMHCLLRKRHETLNEDLKKGVHYLLQVFLAIILQTILLLAVALTFMGLHKFFLHDFLLMTENLWGTLLISIFFIINFLLLIYIETLFVFFLPLIVIERRGIISAIKNSALLVWNHWWRTFSVQATPWVVYVCILLFLKWLLGINVHVYFLEDYPHQWWEAILNTLLFALLIPWSADLLLLQLKDLEIRKKLAR